jgi:hypothetical protein
LWLSVPVSLGESIHETEVEAVPLKAMGRFVHEAVAVNGLYDRHRRVAGMAFAIRGPRQDGAL